MKAEQKVIARWMERIKKLRGWSWARWASDIQDISPTTLSRAVKDNYESVTSVETLHKLARAANVPSVLDFLEGDAVSATALKIVLADMLPLTDRRKWSELDVEHFVQALLYALELPPSDPTKPADRSAYEVAARAGVARFRHLTGES